MNANDTVVIIDPDGEEYEACLDYDVTTGELTDYGCEFWEGVSQKSRAELCAWFKKAGVCSECGTKIPKGAPRAVDYPKYICLACDRFYEPPVGLKGWTIECSTGEPFEVLRIKTLPNGLRELVIALKGTGERLKRPKG